MFKYELGSLVRCRVYKTGLIFRVSYNSADRPFDVFRVIGRINFNGENIYALDLKRPEFNDKYKPKMVYFSERYSTYSRSINLPFKRIEWFSEFNEKSLYQIVYEKALNPICNVCGNFWLG